MPEIPTIIDVNASNVEETGFFCLMSRKKSVGYQRKLQWLQDRFAEGMRIKLLALPERGFIEYLPGEYAWRSVNAQGYMFIHCLWVVGKSKGKGYAGLLLNECMQDAQKADLRGVAMATREGNWLMGKKLLLKHGFELIDEAPLGFELLVKKFDDAPSPSFTNGWEEKCSRYGDGLTIIRSDQCPYLEDGTNFLLEAAEQHSIKSQVIELKSAQDVRELSPSAYGVFNVVYSGKLLSYHYLLKRDIPKLFENVRFNA